MILGIQFDTEAMVKAISHTAMRMICGQYCHIDLMVYFMVIILNHNIVRRSKG